MADNIANITLAGGEWIDLYAEASITVGTAIAVENIGACDVRLTVRATQPPTNYESFNILRRDSEVLRCADGAAGAWAFSPNGDGKVAVRVLDDRNGFYPETGEVNIPPVSVDDVGIKDTTDTQIDPAAKQKQQEQIDQVGEVQENPTQYTVLARLKAIKDCLDTASGGTSNADLLAAIQSFEAAFNDEDFATETTLLNVLQCCQNVDSDTSQLVTLQAATNAAIAALTTTEDEPSADGQKGIPAMEVANEAQADLVDNDGDETRGASDKKGTRYVRDEALKAEAIATNNHLQSIDDELVIANAELADQTTELEEANTKTGEVQENPTPNTVLGRLKDIWQAITGSKTQAWEQIYKYATPTDAALASGADFTIDPALNTEANANDTGWIAITGADGSHKPNQKITVKSNVDLVLHVMNATDASGSNITGNTAGEAISVFAGIPRVVASNFFTSHFRVVVKNISGSSATQLSIASYGGTATPTSFIGALTSALFDFFPVLHTRAVSVGKRDDNSGLYSNVNVHKDGNDYVSLAVASGHRTSQLFGRTPVTIRGADLTSDTTLDIVEDGGTVHTSVPAGFMLFVVSYSWSCINTSVTSAGRGRIEDDGALIVPIGCSEAGGIFGDDAFNSGSGASPDEPLRFATDVGYNEVSGTVTADIYMRGYLEAI